MSDKLTEVLKGYDIPDEVFIGTDSPVDKVEWLIRRLKMKEATLVRLRREVEILEAGVRHYSDESFWDDPPDASGYADGTQYNYESEFDGAVSGDFVAKETLAELEKLRGEK